MTQQRAVKARVSGHVQGVFFRKSTQQQALSLGLTGYAKNLADGSVEVVACGAPEPVASLLDYLSRGPQTARVDTVETEDIATGSYDGFEVC